jgi:hypothetical protein
LRKPSQTRTSLPFAASLENAHLPLSKLGHHEHALAARQELVDVYRRLSQTKPDAFLPDLSATLNTVSADLAALGRHQEALAASRESVEIRRRLAQADPEAYVTLLATSLNNFAVDLAHFGRNAEATQAASEALTILLPLLGHYRDKLTDFVRDLADNIRLYSEAAGEEPDTALLARAARALSDSDAAQSE